MCNLESIVSIFFKQTVTDTEKDSHLKFLNMLLTAQRIFDTHADTGAKFVSARKISRGKCENLTRVHLSKIEGHLSGRLANNLKKLATNKVSKIIGFVTVNGTEYQIENLHLSMYSKINQPTSNKFYYNPQSFSNVLMAEDSNGACIRHGCYIQNDAYFLRDDAQKHYRASVNGTGHISKNVLLEVAITYKDGEKFKAITKRISKYDIEEVIFNTEASTLDSMGANRKDNPKLDSECLVTSLLAKFSGISLTLGLFELFEYRDREYENINKFSTKDIFVEYMNLIIFSNSKSYQSTRDVLNRVVFNYSEKHDVQVKDAVEKFVQEGIAEFESITTFDSTYLYESSLKRVLDSGLFEQAFVQSCSKVCKRLVK